MIDFTLFAFTLAVLLVGVWYACTSANIAGRNDVEDDGRGDPPPNIVRFARRRPSGDAGKPNDHD